MMSLQELLIQVDGLSVSELRLSVRRGWVRPSTSVSDDSGRQRRHLRFLEVDAARLRLIRELREDFDLDDETLPLVLSLMDQVYTLRTDIRHLTTAIGQQPEAVRRDVASIMRSLRPD